MGIVCWSTLASSKDPPPLGTKHAPLSLDPSIMPYPLRPPIKKAMLVVAKDYYGW